MLKEFIIPTDAKELPYEWVRKLKRHAKKFPEYDSANPRQKVRWSKLEINPGR